MRIFLVEIQEVSIFLFSCFSNIFHSVSLELQIEKDS